MSYIMSTNNIIHWFESAALDNPELRSPQPCKRGIHCDYKLMDEASGELVRACCSGVHPGEEGTGRRLFPARMVKDMGQDGDGKYEQPACVRLTGASEGFYMRRRLRLSWAEWCEQHGISFTPALPGQPFEPVVRMPLGGRRAQDSFVPSPAHAMPQGGSIAPVKLTKNQRKRANKRAAKVEASISCEDLDAELRAGAHSPRPGAVQGIVFREANRSTGMCTPGCVCFSGGECGDRAAYNHGCTTPFLTCPPAISRLALPLCPSLIAEEASAAARLRLCLLLAYCPEKKSCGAQPPTPLNLMSGYNTTVNNQGPSTYEEGISPYIPIVSGPQPPTPLNLLPGYITQPEEDDNRCFTPTLLHMPVNDEDDEENDTPALSLTHSQ